jgi:hypothetical protein
MNFSAQGYAELTSLLKPDIAVLEGGYAIEGALPYVNMGIILALAGIDTSHVKEPGYDPDKIRQTDDVTDWIHKIADKVLYFWESRDKTQASLQAGKTFDERTRRIFYDTDNIHESQKETIRICDACGGVLKVDSSSSQGHHILAVHIPRNACKDCREVGYDWYESPAPSEIEQVYLQDRTTDSFQTRTAS